MFPLVSLHAKNKLGLFGFPVDEYMLYAVIVGTVGEIDVTIILFELRVAIVAVVELRLVIVLLVEFSVVIVPVVDLMY